MDPFEEDDFISFSFLYLIDMFPSIIFQDLYSDTQRIEECPLDCNLTEITPIQDLPGQVGSCAQQSETSLFCVFLAHLSQRLRMSYFDHSSSIVHPSTPLNNFSSETPGPVFFKLPLESSVNGVLKVYTNGFSPLIKMATMPIYGKNTEKSSSPEPRKLEG